MNSHHRISNQQSAISNQRRAAGVTLSMSKGRSAGLLVFTFAFCLIAFFATAQRPVKKPHPNKVTTSTVYWNTEQTYTASCDEGYTGADVPVTVAAHTYSSGASIAAANDIALAVATAAAEGLLDCEADATPPGATIINMASVYGITGGTGVDNTTALMDFNADYQAEDNYIILDFRSLGPVEIRYSDNTWLYGIDSFKVWGAGCTFRCTSTGPFATDLTSLTSAGIFWQNRYGGTGGLNQGYTFNTVSAGSSSLTLNVTGPSLTAGDRVYLSGYEEQRNGQPVNPRFFEWKVVVSVAGSTITFTEPLKYRYDTDWEDVQMPGFNPPTGDADGPHGKPRLFKISNNYCRYAEFANCIMGKGTHVASDVLAYFFFKAQKLVCDSVTIGEDWPSETEVAIRRNCTITTGDLDKNVAFAEYNNCTITSGLLAATGIDSLRLINNPTIGGYCALSPRVLYAEGNHFYAVSQHNIYDHPEGTWSQYCYLKNNIFTFSGMGSSDPHVRYYSSTFPAISGTNSSQIIVAGANYYVAKALGFGSTITTSGASATVVNITFNGTNHVIHLTAVSGTPASGQTWTMNGYQKVVDLGGNTSTVGHDIYDIIP